MKIKHTHEIRYGNKQIEILEFTLNGKQERVEFETMAEVSAFKKGLRLTEAALAQDKPMANDRATLDQRMKDAGMISLTEMLSGQPIDRFIAHAGVRNIDDFQKWVDMRRAEFATMRCQYELGDHDKDDDMFEWVMAHSNALSEVAINLRQALETDGKVQ